MTHRLLRPLALALAALLAAGALPARAAEAKDAKAGKKEDRRSRPRGAVIEGRVLEADGSGANGLTVIVTPLAAPGTGEAAALTGTTGRAGEFEIRHVPYGVYDIGFVREGRGYPSNSVVIIEPGRENELEFRLGEIGAQDAAVGVVAGATLSGLPVPAAGVARLDERFEPRGLAWLRTGKGVATVVGLSALIVGGIIIAADDDDEATPPTVQTP